MSFMSRKNYADQQRESDVAIASPMELVALSYERLLELLQRALTLRPPPPRPPPRPPAG